MEIKDFLAVQPENLASEQEARLRDYVSKKLSYIATLVDNDYQAVLRMLEDSPSGDDHGLDNRYIDFSEVAASGDFDLGDVMDRLINLRAMAQKNP